MGRHHGDGMTLVTQFAVTVSREEELEKSLGNDASEKGNASSAKRCGGNGAARRSSRYCARFRGAHAVCRGPRRLANERFQNRCIYIFPFHFAYSKACQYLEWEAFEEAIDGFAYFAAALLRVRLEHEP